MIEGSVQDSINHVLATALAYEGWGKLFTNLAAQVIGGVSAGIAAVLVWLRAERKADEGALSIVQSEYENYSRHAGASLSRLEDFLAGRQPLTTAILEKFKFFEDGFVARNQDGLTRLPRNLRLGVMRTQIFIRNTDTHIDDVIRQLCSGLTLPDNEKKELITDLAQRIARSREDANYICHQLELSMRQGKRYRDEPLPFMD